MKRKCLKICCFITAILILLLIVTFVTLYFTVFKQKQPQVVATPVNLEHFEFNPSTFALNVTLGVEIVIKNPNYAGFRYHNATTLIFYHGELVGQAQVEEGTVDSRSTETILSSVDIQVTKVIRSIYFLPDILSPAGSLNFTSSSRIEGKVILLEVFKLHASTLVSCDISVFVFKSSSSSYCSSKIAI